MPFSDFYICLYNSIFHRIYDVPNAENNNIDQDDGARWKEFDRFYGLSYPSAPLLDKPPQLPLSVDMLKLLHIFAMKDDNDKDPECNVGYFRNKSHWAYSPWPIVYAPPEQVNPLMTQFCGWFNSWWIHVENLSAREFREFSLSMIPRIVMVHPYMDGNKRTARLFTNVLLNGRLGYFYDWNYKNIKKREKYQQKFARGSLTGDFPSSYIFTKTKECLTVSRIIRIQRRLWILCGHIS